MSKENDEKEVAEIFTSLRTSIELIEKKFIKHEKEITPEILQRLKQLRSDVSILGKSDNRSTLAIGGLIQDLGILKELTSACGTCKHQRIEALRGDFEKKLEELKKFKEEKNKDESQRVLREIRREYSEFPETWLELGHFYDDEQDYNNALACFRIAEESGQLGYIPLCMIGQTLFALKKYQESKEELEKCIIKYPPTIRCASFFRMLAYTYFHDGNLNDVERISEFIEIPDSVYPSLISSYLYLLLGDFDRAYMKIKSIKEEIPPDFKLMQAVLKGKTGDINSALVDLAKIPLDKVELDFFIFDPLKLLSGLFTEDEHCSILEILVRKLVSNEEYEPDNYILIEFISMASNKAMNLKCSDLELYIDIFLESRKHVGEELYSGLDSHIISLLAYQGKMLEANEKAQEFSTEGAWYGLGTGLCHSGNPEKAIIAFRKALDCNSEFEPAWTCYLTILKKLERNDEFNEALKEATTVLGRTPIRENSIHCDTVFEKPSEGDA